MKYRIYTFEHALYEGNVELDFYFFCIHKRPSIIKYLIIQLWYWVIYRMHIIKREKAYTQFYVFLKSFSDINLLLEEFWDQHQDKIKTWYLFRMNKRNDLIVSKYPLFLIEPLLKRIGIKKMVATEIDWNTETLNCSICIHQAEVEMVKKKIKKGTIEVMYGDGETHEELFLEADQAYLTRNRKIIPFSRRKLRRSVDHQLLNISMLFLFSWVLTIMMLGFSLKSFSWNQLFEYLGQFDLMLLNFMPVFLVMLFFYLLFNRLWACFGITALLFIVLAFVNHFKLMYRDDPFTFLDFSLLSEAVMMTKRYTIAFTPQIWLGLGAILLFILILFIGNQHRIRTIWIRLVGLPILVLTFFFLLHTVYQDEKVYEQVGDREYIDSLSEMEQYASRGFLYPFLYSIKTTSFEYPSFYNEQKAIETLEQYEYQDIAEDKKVNVIAIMLEAFQDFSKFGIEFDVDPYKDYHDILKESYAGYMVSNTFGAGTINAERSFTTGYYDFPPFDQDTNSFLWYMREQGYYVEGAHPIYGYFYDREKVNPKLGFQAYYNYENYFRELNKDFFMDHDFFGELVKKWEESKTRDQPYFQFSTSYQNHGPYSAYHPKEAYIPFEDGYNYPYYNTINNYFTGVAGTGVALKELITYFKKEKEPVVFMVFADHNPFLGEEENAYQMLGINLNRNTEEGFLNYYEVPYFIWANESAKEVTGKSFTGKAPTISPTYLMLELFDYLGWTGNEYMQLLKELQEKIPVLHNPIYYEGKKFTTSLSEEGKTMFDQFQNAEYYYFTHFNVDSSVYFKE